MVMIFKKRLSAQTYAEFGIEGSPRLLQAEIVVKFLICEVAALQREVVTSLLHAVAEREVVGELVWDIKIVNASEYLGIIGETVRILTVVGQCEQIASASQPVPVEGHVVVGKAVGHVGDARLVTEILHHAACCPYLVFLVVAHVHLSEVASDAQHIPEHISHREVIPLGQHLSVVGVGGILTSSAEVLHVALYVVFGVAKDKAPFLV